MRRLAVLCLTLAGGCRCNEQQRPAPDAQMVDAATTAQARPAKEKLRVVATMGRYNADFYPKTSVDLDGTVYVTSGGFAYEARDGKLVPLRSVDAYTPTMQASSVPLLGFESSERDEPIEHVAKDASGKVRLFAEHRDWSDGAVAQKNLTVWSPVLFRGGLVTRDYDHGVAWIGADKGEGGPTFAVKPAPREKLHYRDLTVTRDGTLVAPIDGRPEVALWRPGVRLDAGEIVVLGAQPRPDAGHSHEYRACEVAPSFDGNTYVCCESSDYQAPEPTLHRFDGTRFVDAFAGVSGRCRPLPSIDRAGNLYRVMHEAGKDQTDRLERCSASGSCEPIEIEPLDLRTPTYSLSFAQVRDENGSRWFSLGVIERTPETSVTITHVYARAPDDVWVMGTDVVFHSRGAGRPEAVVNLPSRVDARVRVQNEQPPLSWTKDCDSVFIQLAAGSSVDAGAHSDLARIGEVLGEKGPPVEWALVTGRLYDREVAGVIAWRDEYDWKRAEMNARIEQFVEAFTRDPMNVPRVHCTLPVLSGVVTKPSR